MRLFVAAEVPPAVQATIDAAVERPPGADVRWSAAGSWHVTFRFLGEVDGAAEATAALARVVAVPATAVVDPRPRRLGPTALVLHVEGLDAIATAVGEAFAGLPGEEGRPFTGHLTLGRLKRVGRWPAAGVGPLQSDVAWRVEEVCLVRSHLGGGPARYEVLARRRLG